MLDPHGAAFRRAVGAVPGGRTAPGSRTSGRPAAEVSEDELARRVGTGDEEAFAELCRRRSLRLHALCRGVLHNAEDAHDAVGSATEKALAALRRGQLRGDVRPWLSVICRNEALSLLRSRNPWAALDDVAAGTAPSPEATVLLRERLAGMAQDLADLPERQRRAIVLREVAELPYDRVAVRLGMRQDAARQAVHEARTALRDGAEGRDLACEGVRGLLADGDGRRRRARRVRSHLRICESCRRWDADRGGRPALARAFLPGLWAALPGAFSWLPGAPALLAPAAGGGAFSGAAQAMAVALAVVATPVVVPASRDGGADRPAAVARGAHAGGSSVDGGRGGPAGAGSAGDGSLGGDAARGAAITGTGGVAPGRAGALRAVRDATGRVLLAGAAAGARAASDVGGVGGARPGREAPDAATVADAGPGAGRPTDRAGATGGRSGSGRASGSARGSAAAPASSGGGGSAGRVGDAAEPPRSVDVRSGARSDGAPDPDASGRGGSSAGGAWSATRSSAGGTATSGAADRAGAARTGGGAASTTGGGSGASEPTARSAARPEGDAPGSGAAAGSGGAGTASEPDATGRPLGPGTA